MSRKSAKSKGYRKQTVKKPYLSKREIALLCVIVAAIAVAAFFLFRYDDGALTVQDGAVVAEGDNWLIVNGSNARGRARYFKLGEIGEIEGYARENGALATDANIPEYTFTPETGDTGITVTASHSAAETLAKYAASTLTNLENTEIGEVQAVELAGQPVSYFLYTTEYAAAQKAEDGAEAEAVADGEPSDAGDAADDEGSDAADADTEEAGADRFSRMLSGYVDAAHDSCVVVHVESEADSADGLLADEDLIALLEQAVSAIDLESAK